MDATTHPGGPLLADHLPADLHVGQPTYAGAGELTIFPVFGEPCALEFVAFSQGAATIHEREGDASVNDLVVHNPGPLPVLLFEGEEVIGAQQNRTFDLSVLVGAGARLEVPVSCVEAGRWDGARHDEAFAPAPQTAYPSLRRAKHRQVRAAVAAGAPARADQGAVWGEIAARQQEHVVDSATGAMDDLFSRRRRDYAWLTDGMCLMPGQIGALVFHGEELAVLDVVGRPEVFAALWEPLLEGYALDAMSVRLVAPALVDAVAAAAVLSRLAQLPVAQRDGIGAAREARFAGPELTGAGLVAGEELVQLTAFPSDPSSTPTAETGRIRRPSRRGRRS